MDEQLETRQQNAEHQGDIHAAVMAERDRCALIVNNWLELYGGTNPVAIDAKTWAGDAMRDVLGLIQNPQS